jgi:hypothetical protein
MEVRRSESKKKKKKAIEEKLFLPIECFLLYLKVFSATIHRPGKITKSATAVPGSAEGTVSTVKIDGSYKKREGR